MRQGIGPVLGRVLTIVAGLLLVGLLLKLVAAMLTPVLPAAMSQLLAAGWNLLFSLLGNALPAIAATAILGALLWVFVGRRK
jgi:hypothetical protein